MAKQPKKTPEEMTNDEMRNRFFVLQKRIKWITKKMPWVAGAIGAAGTVLAGAALLFGFPGAVLMCAGSISLGAASLSIAALVRDTYFEDEAFKLNSENNMRLKVAEAQQKRADIKVAQDLKEQFNAAIAAVAEGKGIAQDMTVRRPLRLRNASSAN
ncbi:MAG: hypothetical protein ACAH83_15950 [Alphaproteobacteria bacterium]